MPPVANTLLTISMITNEALRVLENSLTLLKNIDRQYSDKFGVEGAKIGTTLNVRKPPRYVGRTGEALQVEDSTETSAALVLDTLFGVDLDFSTIDLSLSIDNFSDRFLKPAVATIANKMDADAAKQYKYFWNSVGTPGTTPSTLLVYLDAGVKLDNEAAPQDEERGLYLTPRMQATIVDALKGLFQSSEKISSQYVKGRMGVAGGFNWHMDQNMTRHTVGTYSGTPLVNGASQIGSTLVTDGWGSGVSTLNEGDVFTIAGVYHANPQSRETTEELQDFRVVTQISDTTGAMSIAIEPAIIISGAYQTVSASPADNAAITVRGATGVVSAQGLALHRDAITFASADLMLPRGVDMAGRASDSQLGISIRMVRAYDINTNHMPMRLECLYGFKVLRPELGVRIWG